MTTKEFISTKNISKVTPQTTTLSSLLKAAKDPMQFLLDARETYGDVYTLNLGLTKALIFNNPEHAQIILRDRASIYQKGGPMWEGMAWLLIFGLAVATILTLLVLPSVYAFFVETLRVRFVREPAAES